METDIALLLPRSFCERLGMVLDTDKGLITWKCLGGKQSEVLELPCEHLALDILEVPPGRLEEP
eukprot:3506357-Karenia_brevis.AAC.1